MGRAYVNTRLKSKQTSVKKQADVVLPLKTRHPAAITELITHA